MKILWLTWKDLKHPQAGGAEVINEAIASRLARDGHEVILLVASFQDGAKEEIRDGYKIIRMGNRFTVYWQAYRYYKKSLRGWADLVIDEMNTIPFFCKTYSDEKNILFVHQLCREIWFYQMAFPLSVLGYLLEPIYLRLLNDRFVVAMSESTKSDLLRHGFSQNRITVIPEGIVTQPIDSPDSVEKYEKPTVLSFGAIRAMKRTLDQIQAFEIAKVKIPGLQMKIAGGVSDAYGKKVLRRIATSKHANDIEYLGRVDDEKKAELMQKAHFILVTSVKEGWGLIVTEANTQGAPAVVYDVDGLRDSVRNGETGLICKENTPQGLAAAVVVGLGNPLKYATMRKNAWMWSKSFHLESTYRSFLQAIRNE